MEKPEKPDWERMEREVVNKLRILRVAWEHTAEEMPHIHEVIRRDLYIPALKYLALFVASVDEGAEREWGFKKGAF